MGTVWMALRQRHGATGSNLAPVDAAMAEALCYDLLRGLVPPGKSEEGYPCGVGSPLGPPISSLGSHVRRGFFALPISGAKWYIRQVDGISHE
jgi:hypothetical protein